MAEDMIRPEELMLGNWVETKRDILGVGVVDMALPVSIELLNEMICKGTIVKPIPLTPERLEKDGWERKGNILCLKSNPRLGWKIDSQTFILGYTELPFPVRYYHEVQNIMNVLHICPKTAK